MLSYIYFLNDLKVIWNYNKPNDSYWTEILDEAAFWRGGGEEGVGSDWSKSQATSHRVIHGVASVAEYVYADLQIDLSSKEPVPLWESRAAESSEGLIFVTGR